MDNQQPDVFLLTAELIQRRNEIRELLGEHYAGHVREAQCVLCGVERASGLTLASTALRIAQEMSAAGHSPALMIAALVEEAEARGV